MVSGCRGLYRPGFVWVLETSVVCSCKFRSEGPAQVLLVLTWLAADLTSFLRQIGKQSSYNYLRSPG